MYQNQFNNNHKVILIKIFLIFEGIAETITTLIQKPENIQDIITE